MTRHDLEDDSEEDMSSHEAGEQASSSSLYNLRHVRNLSSKEDGDRRPDVSNHSRQPMRPIEGSTLLPSHLVGPQHSSEDLQYHQCCHAYTEAGVQ